MDILVNGEPQQVTDDTTVTALLQQLNVRPERVVVEINLAILKRHQLATTMLQPGDRVEIVHFVGGGSCAKNEWPSVQSHKYGASRWWPDMRENLLWGLDPRKGLGVGVPGLQKAFDGRAQLDHRAKTAPANRPPREDAEPGLDLVEPRGAGRREVTMQARSPLEPPLDLGGRVGAGVVQHEVQFARGIGRATRRKNTKTS